MSGVSPTSSARKIEKEVRTHFPHAVVTYEPGPEVMQLSKTARTETFDDSCAREEWGRKLQYARLNAVVADFIEEVRAHAPRYNLP